MKYLFFILWATLPCVAFAQNLSFDLNFGVQGGVEMVTGNETTDAFVIKMQADQKILITGQTYLNFSQSVAPLVRLLPDGTPDSTFGENGKKIFAFQPGLNQLQDILPLNDGKLLVAGTASTTFLDFCLVARLLPNGTPDSTFGVNGIILFQATSADASGHKIALTPEGKILLGGTSYFAGKDILLVQFTADGQIDSGFGNNGWVRYDIATGDDSVSDLHVFPDGKILICGNYEKYDPVNNTTSGFFVKRFNHLGQPDPTFGTGNEGLLLPGYFSSDMEVLADGSALIGGSGGYTAFGVADRDFAAFKITPDGELDNSFAENGIFSKNGGKYYEYINTLKLHPDGRIILGGSSNGNQSALLILQPTGQLLTNFGTDGVTLLQYNNRQSSGCEDMVVLPNGKMICAGSWKSSTEQGFLITQQLSPATVGTNEKPSEPVQVFPNPNNGHFRAHLPPGDITFFRLYNLQGQLVYETTIAPTNATVDLQLPVDCSAGRYQAVFYGKTRVYSASVMIAH